MNKNLLKIYKEFDDPLYIIRFIDYKINQRHPKRTVFMANGSTVKCLISGVLKELKTEKLYNSLAEWFNDTLPDNMSVWYPEGNEELLEKIYHKEDATLYDLFCKVTDSDILYFTDKKYRVFSMYNDLRKRVEYYLGIEAFKDNEYEVISWNRYKFIINTSSLKKYDSTGTHTFNDLLDAYESGNIKNLYYYWKDKNELHKIC